MRTPGILTRFGTAPVSPTAAVIDDAPPASGTARDPSLDELRAEATYRRNRLALYRARILTRRATSAARLRELERASEGASERLHRAEQRAAPGSAR